MGVKMSKTKWTVVGLAWIVSLLLTGVWVRAQVGVAVPLPTPTVISGADIGFRIESLRGGTPIGRLVIRTSSNAEWVEPELAGGMKRLAER